jgi:5-methylthioadenosine/S-adenosylhomocysteine deaminase
LVKHLHAVPGLYAQPITAAQIFRMATEHGARSIGFGNEIGAIEIGKRADLVLLDYRAICGPFMDKATSVVDAVIYRAKAQHVSTVLINGRIVYDNNKFTFVDKEDIYERLSANLDRPLREDEQQRAAFSCAIFPHVRDFYKDWELSSSNPFYHLNSR